MSSPRGPVSLFLTPLPSLPLLLNLSTVPSGTPLLKRNRSVFSLGTVPPPQGLTEHWLSLKIRSQSPEVAATPTTKNTETCIERLLGSRNCSKHGPPHNLILMTNL